MSRCPLRQMNLPRSAIALLFALSLVELAATGACAEELAATQWRALELRFTSNGAHPNPFAVTLIATFEGPDGSKFAVPGFWDGGNTWKVRFAPTVPGHWRYRTKAEGTSDSSLSGQVGAFEAAVPQGDNLLFKHGGFLKVSRNGRYLTYTDGTPFFWLGDTWWFCPSRLCPIDASSNPAIPSMFKMLVDTRSRQDFTVVQFGFAGEEDWLLTPRPWTESTIRFWQDVDRYISYANEHGLLPVIGVGFHSELDKPTLADFKFLWRYLVARYGAYPITWLIAGEYNLYDVSARVNKIHQLGQYIKDIDPYQRAMTVNPAESWQDKRQAWDQPWYDFIMLQGGHGLPPPVSTYATAYRHEPAKPVLEDECMFEGIHGYDADRVRLVSYRAIQSGTFGYEYGAHGLWYPTQNSGDEKFKEYGTPIPWWEALQRPGAAQMQHLRKLYESVNWWELEPRLEAVSAAPSVSDEDRVLTKARGDDLFVIYFPAIRAPATKVLLSGSDARALYRATWYDPRNGAFKEVVDRLEAEGKMLVLPRRPSMADWILVVRKRP